MTEFDYVIRVLERERLSLIGEWERIMTTASKHGKPSEESMRAEELVKKRIREIEETIRLLQSW